jgi:HD-GYP domain-containing protein (c-di-GMP phosphodiesterase class II)
MERSDDSSSFVAAMSAALDSRDPLTAIHSINVANYAVGIGEILGLATEEIQWLRLAGLLHDVGKIGIPESVLMKPGRLTSVEFEEMKRHADYSRAILSKIKFMKELQGLDALASAHHERLDGSGYPEGLRADQLQQKARILAVADVFDALTQTRHYRVGMTMHEAFKEIGAMTPHQLDAHCVGALKAFLGCGPWPIN